MENQKNLFERSKQLIPGGVHSPVRSFKGLESTPRFIEKAEGAYIYDTEGKSYIDFCMSFGPLILGHKDNKVEECLQQALKKGWSYGACEPYSLELAQYILNRIPFLDQIRFVNSGTEAVMTALRLARGKTGRDKILKFNGCYHGHVDSMLIKAGSGLAGTSTASSKGIPKNVAEDTLILDLNDEKALEECFDIHGKSIAGVIIEPLPANNGLLIQNSDFLKKINSLCKANGSLLIFDEVISGFRVNFSGMAHDLDITPDIVTYGKVIGGGLPVGAIAATRSVMETLAPVGDVYQAGTLSANPLAMVGGLSTLKQLDEATYKKVDDNALKIEELFSDWFKNYENGKFSHYKIIRYKSLFWFVPNNSDLKSIDDIPQNLAQEFLPLFETLLEKGIYLSPNAYEIGFVSLAHDSEVLKDLERRLYN
tara:strand:+ start:1015 stop:2286 length:1272 start_codon:yes stop_codon:yes gene_type:complete